MDWLNLHYSVLNSEAFIGSEPVDRATWLCLLQYCVSQENGGMIFGAAAWSDRKWQQLCRITKAEVARKSNLWWREGGYLRVLFYPDDKEREVQAKRRAGQLGGQAKSPAKTEAAKLNGAIRSQAEPKQNPSTGTEADPTEGKGREWKEEGKEEGKPTTAAIPSQKIDTKALLAGFGLPCGATDVTEWRGGLKNVAVVHSLGEAKAFVSWALVACKAAGIAVEHFRHVRQLAVEWNAGQRNNHWKAA